MASLSGCGGSAGFLGLLLWLQLLRPLLSGGYRPQEESQVTMAGSEAQALRRHLKLPKIPDPAVAPWTPTPAGSPGSGATSESPVGQFLQSDGDSNPFGDVLPSACGRRSMRIYGGKEAPKRKWPWQVSLQSYNRHVCGGSLITNRLVLTAAHCIVGRQREYTVMLGHNELYDFDENQVVVPVKDIVLHQYYHIRQVTNDIAIALLAFPVNYSAYIQPICLPERPLTVKAETLCWVTGWGRMEGNVPPLILREAEQKILSQKQCNQRFQRYFRIPFTIVREGMICGTDDVRRSPCWGDSGGPLVCEVNDTWIQIGVVSWGYMCGQDLLPAVYTDVIQFKKWIHNILDILNQASHIYSMGVNMILVCLMLPMAILVTV